MKHTETMYNPVVSSWSMILAEDLFERFQIYEQSISHVTTMGLEFIPVVRIRATLTRQTKNTINFNTWENDSLIWQ